MPSARDIQLWNMSPAAPPVAPAAATAYPYNPAMAGPGLSPGPVNIGPGVPQLTYPPQIGAGPPAGIGGMPLPTDPLNAPAANLGGNAGALGAAPIMQAPGQQPNGGFLGMSGPVFAQALMGGVLGFMGGYQRNPALTAMGARMTADIGPMMEAEKMKRLIAQNTPQDGLQTPEDYQRVGNALASAGNPEAASEYLRMGKIGAELRNADEAEFMQATSTSQRENFKVFREFDKVRAVTSDFTKPVNQMTDEERRAIITSYAKMNSPEALSDQEFQRNVRDVTGGVIPETLKTFLGFGATTPSDTVVKNLLNEIMTMTRGAQRNQAWIVESGKQEGRALQLPNYPYAIPEGDIYESTPSSLRAKRGLPGAWGKSITGFLQDWDQLGVQYSPQSQIIGQ